MATEPFPSSSTPADRAQAENEEGDAGKRSKQAAAKARWTILRQVLKQKPLENAGLQQISIRRFASFGLFSITEDSNMIEDDSRSWVQYKSIYYPDCIISLRIYSQQDHPKLEGHPNCQLKKPSIYIGKQQYRKMLEQKVTVAMEKASINSGHVKAMDVFNC
ncbi:calmodulin-lysine N-methyltransferase-like [Crotalus tigris]|uniref:calmodulin-lysine N-methyltransferase-like n=1 Tax=Crotalus tigris TaxID=88082 RepID=UPI00192F3D06|nr:calmodulin-lysine N-methyltransferase-like [Crotalus tigris]